MKSSGIIAITLMGILLSGCQGNPFGGTTASDRSADSSSSAIKPDAWRQFTLEAEQAQQEGRLKDAESKWGEALREAVKFGDKDIRYQSSLHALAQLQSSLGEYAAAEENFSQLIALEDKYHKGEFLGLAWNLSELGDVYYQERKYKQAMEAYKRSANIAEVSGRMIAMVASTRKLANALVQLGDYKSAALMYGKAKAFGDEALRLPQYADYRFAILDQMAQLASDRNVACNKLKQYKTGLKFALEAQHDWSELAGLSFEIKREPAPLGELAAIVRLPANPKGPPKTMLDEIGPEVINALEKIAFYYCHMGKYMESELLFGRIIEIFNLMSDDIAGLNDKRMEFMQELYRSWHSCHGALPSYWVAEEFFAKNDPDLANIDNKFLAAFASIKHGQDYYEERLSMPQRFAWAVPTAEALKAIKNRQPIVEAGAGTGYWASLLRKMGVDIIAYDIKPVPSHDNAWHFRAEKSWSEVLTGDETIVSKHPDRTLFICWPPGDDPFAYKALSLYQGKTFIYVGESYGGCNGNPAFFNLLDKKWRLVKTIALPQWPGIYDAMYIYERKK